MLLFYLTYRNNVEHREVSTLVKEKHLRGIIGEGIGIIPKTVRMDDSHNISLDLTLSEDFVSTDNLCKSGDYLEAELQGVELKVDGEKRLKICEASPLPITGWNCSFATPDTHTMNLIINTVKRDNSRGLIFKYAHDVKVHSFWSVSLVPILTLVIPILVAVIQTLLPPHTPGGNATK